jgi:hypothetical protein
MTEQSEDKRRARLINAVLERVDVDVLIGQVELNPSKQATWDQPADRGLVTLVTTSR